MFGEIEPMINYFLNRDNTTLLIVCGFYSIIMGGVIYFINQDVVPEINNARSIRNDLNSLSKDITELKKNTDFRFNMRKAEEHKIDQDITSINNDITELEKALYFD